MMKTPILDPKTQSLLKKLQALAERGIDGEKVNAQSMLDKLLEKHGIKKKDIEKKNKKWHPFSVPEGNERLFYQVASTVLGKTIVADPYTDFIYLKCTTSDFIEIEAKYDFYYRAFCEEAAILLDAFIRKNDLSIKEDYSFVDINSISEAERERIQRETDMADSVKEYQFQPPSKLRQLPPAK